MVKLAQKLPLDQMQVKWAADINPVLINPLVAGRLIQDTDLIIGNNIINHKLGRKLQGWFLVGINGAAQIYDNQATNQMTDLTLSLTSDANVKVALWVF